MLKHSLSLLWGSNALCDNVCAALSPCPFCQIMSPAHLALRRCSLADPTHGAATGGQHCTLAWRQKARMLYLEVRLLNLQETEQKDNAGEPLSMWDLGSWRWLHIPMKFPSKPLGICTVQGSDCKILGFIFMLYIVTNPNLVNSSEISHPCFFGSSLW